MSKTNISVAPGSAVNAQDRKDPMVQAALDGLRAAPQPAPEVQQQLPFGIEQPAMTNQNTRPPLEELAVPVESDFNPNQEEMFTGMEMGVAEAELNRQALPALDNRMQDEGLSESAQYDAIQTRGELGAGIVGQVLAGTSLTEKQSETFVNDPTAALAAKNNNPKVPIKNGSPISVTTQSILFEPSLLNAGIAGPDGKIVADAGTLALMNIVTEAYFATEATKASPDMQEKGAEESLEIPGAGVTKAQGAEALGKTIFTEVKRMQAETKGTPNLNPKELQEISPYAFTFMGNLAKFNYAIANPDLVKVQSSAYDSANGYDNNNIDNAYYIVTAAGRAVFDANQKTFKKISKTYNKNPILDQGPEGSGRFEGETELGVRNITKKLGPLGNMDRVNKALQIYGTVPMIVEPRKESLLFMFATFGLLTNQTKTVDPTTNKEVLDKEDSTWNPADDIEYSSMIGAGAKKRTEIRKKKELLRIKAERNPSKHTAAYKAFNVDQQIADETAGVISSLAGIADNANKAVNIPYSLQGVTGRINAQTSPFNPQGNKMQRSIVTGANSKVSWKPGNDSSIDNFFKEAIAITLFSKITLDSKTKPEELSSRERINLFNKLEQTNNPVFLQALEYGKELSKAASDFDVVAARQFFSKLDQVTDNAQGNELKKAFMGKFFNKEKIESTLTIPLRRELAKKDNQAAALADKYIDLFNWHEAKKAGTKFTTAGTVEMDGTTHGPASAAITLGIVSMAERAGIIRTQDYSLNDAMDMRLAMAESMLANIDATSAATIASSNIKGGANNSDNYKTLLPAGLSAILNLAVTDKTNFLKPGPMVMGYGALIPSLRQYATDTMYTGEKSKEIQTVMESYGMTMDEQLVESFLFNSLVASIFDIMDPKTIEAARLMKANGFFSVMTDVVMSYKNSSGYTTYVAGQDTVADPMQGRISLRKDSEVSEGIPGSSTVTYYERKTSPSALGMIPGTTIKVPGTNATGGIAAATAQSLDGGMITSLAADYYPRIKKESSSHGEKRPLILPIFDAVVTSYAAGSAVRSGMNEAHLKVLKDTNYINEIANVWYRKAHKELRDNLLANPHEIIDMNDAHNGIGPWKGVAYLFSNADAKYPDTPPLFTQLATILPQIPLTAGMTVQEHQKINNAQAKRVGKKLLETLSSRDLLNLIETTGKPLATGAYPSIRSAQLYGIIEEVTKAIRLTGRNKDLVATTNVDRKKLFDMQKSGGMPTRNVDLTDP